MQKYIFNFIDFYKSCIKQNKVKEKIYNFYLIYIFFFTFKCFFDIINIFIKNIHSPITKNTTTFKNFNFRGYFMKKKITSLTAGAALIGSIGSFSVSADPGKTTNKSEKTKSDLTHFLSKDRKDTSLPEEKNEQRSKMGLFFSNKESNYDWNVAEEYQEKENIANEKHENIEEKESISQERNEEKGSETEKNVLNLEDYVPNKKNKYGKVSSPNAKENKSGKFHKFVSAAAGVAKGLLNVADTIATTFTGGKTTSEKIGGMAGVVGGQYISGAICAAVGVSVSMPFIGTFAATSFAYSYISKYTNRYIATAACAALVAGSVFTFGLSAFGLAAIASTVATSVIYSITDKITIGTGKYIGGRIGNFFSNSPKVEEKKDANPPPNDP